MIFEVATAVSSNRACSEDRLAVHHIAGGLLVVVADGAGGVAGGGRAADLAVDLVREVAATPTISLFAPEVWVELLARADAVLASDGAAGESTLVVVAVADDGSIVGASCGDSGAWIIRDDRTIDDLTMSQRRHRLGSEYAEPVALQRPALGGTLLVATDGLFSYAKRDAIASIVAEHEDLKRAAVALVEAVRLRGGSLRDDVAVVLARGESRASSGRS